MQVTAQQKLENHINAQTTTQLFAALDTLEAKVTGHFNQGLSNEERLVKAKISDALEARHNLTEALDEIFLDDHYSGTYTAALKSAMTATGQKF